MPYIVPGTEQDIVLFFLNDHAFFELVCRQSPSRISAASFSAASAASQFSAVKIACHGRGIVRGSHFGAGVMIWQGTALLRVHNGLCFIGFLVRRLFIFTEEG